MNTISTDTRFRKSERVGFIRYKQFKFDITKATLEDSGVSMQTIFISFWVYYA